MSLRSEFPLTRFLGKLLAMSPDQVRNACPDKAAAGYGINRAHAAGYIEQQQTLRGVR